MSRLDTVLEFDMLSQSTLDHALARERMRSAESVARQSKLAAHVAAARRWRRLERLAESAHQRYELRAKSTYEESRVLR